MRWMAFAKRNTLEILRDPLTVVFGVGFPVAVLVLLTTIQRHIPVRMFELEQLTPGIMVFGMSFISLFSALLLSKDRSTAFLARLMTTPLTAGEFLLGYALPFLPVAFVQGLVTILSAVLLGLQITIQLVLLCVGMLLVALLFIGLGLLLGSVLDDKQVGGICGALLTNLSAWLSGTWFDISLLGDSFSKIANCLPFIHGVEYGRALLQGELTAAWPHLGWVLGWILLYAVGAVLAFRRCMRS